MKFLHTDEEIIVHVYYAGEKKVRYVVNVSDILPSVHKLQVLRTTLLRLSEREVGFLSVYFEITKEKIVYVSEQFIFLLPKQE